MTSKIIYAGELRTVATHVYSGTIIETDAPLDNNGKGERFSPTDLVATALVSCMMTIMGIAARTHDINIDSTFAETEKIMSANPRRIARINIKMHLKGQKHFSGKQREILEHAAITCPVYQSLNENMIKDIEFIYD